MSWEKSVIGTVLTDPEAYAPASVLNASDFTGPNKIIWSFVSAMGNQGAIDQQFLLNQLLQVEDWARLSGGVNPQDYLRDVLNHRGQNIDGYIAEVLNLSIRRALKKNAALIAVEADNNERTAEDLLEFAETKIMDARRTRMEEAMSIGDIVSLFIPRLEGLRNGTIRPAWVPTIPGLANIIRFAEETDLIVIAGRPGDGKSTLLRHEMYGIAREGRHVLIYNYENDALDYVRNYIGLIMNMDTDIIRNATRLTDQQMATIREGAELLKQLPIKIVDAIGWPITQVYAHARRYVMQNPGMLGAIGLDYFQLVSNGLTNRVDDVAVTSRTTKQMAGKLFVPVMAASQLSRAIEQRSGGRTADPMLSDLRESGAIEQDASIAIFPRVTQNDALEDAFPENRRNGLPLQYKRAVAAKLHVLKHRNGHTGVTPELKWCKHTGRYEAIQ